MNARELQAVMEAREVAGSAAKLRECLADMDSPHEGEARRLEVSSAELPAKVEAEILGKGGER